MTFHLTPLEVLFIIAWLLLFGPKVWATFKQELRDEIRDELRDELHAELQGELP